mgnify:FL=1
MNTLIITLLIISQIANFYLLFKRIKPKIIKTDGVVLKPIAKELKYTDLDPDFNTVYDVLKSIKIEGWELDFEDKFSINNNSYTLNFKSHNNNIRVRSRISVYNREDRDIFLSFYINTDGCSIRIDTESPIKNDIIIFLWDYILEYHENKRAESKVYYESGIEKISYNLKTLNRSRKLEEIL